MTQVAALINLPLPTFLAQRCHLRNLLGWRNSHVYFKAS